MSSRPQYTALEKEAIIKKYLNRSCSRKEFSAEHDLPVSTIDTWVKKYRRQKRELKQRTADFVPVIAEKAKTSSSRTISIDFPGGVRMSFYGDNVIRAVALGRKYYLFKGSESSAQRGAVIYSIIAMAKPHGLDPFKYIRMLLEELPKEKSSNIDKYLPWNIK